MADELDLWAPAFGLTGSAEWAPSDAGCISEERLTPA
jgi:hypothetical protein